MNWNKIKFVSFFLVSVPVLRRKIPGSRHDRNHLLCRCVFHLISLSLKQAEAKLEGLRHLNTVHTEEL